MAIEINNVGIDVSLGLTQITQSVNQQVTNTYNSLTQNVVNLYGFLDTLNEVQDRAFKIQDALAGVAQGVVGFIGSALQSLNGLQAGPDALGVVGEAEVAEAQRYEQAVAGLGSAFEAVKVRVALGIAPQLSSLTERFLTLLDANKELIANGLGKTMEIVGEGLDALVNFAVAINAVVEGTVGWEAALGVLGATLAWIGRATMMAFATNPITWIVAALAGLILLVDDFMTYLDGGDSVLGEFWAPFADGLVVVNEALSRFKAVLGEFWAQNGETVKAFGGDLLTIIGASISSLLNLFGMFFALVRGDFEGLKKAFDGWLESLKTQLVVVAGWLSKVGSYLGFGDDEQERSGEAGNSRPQDAAVAPTVLMSRGAGIVAGARQLSAGVQGAQGQAALGVGGMAMSSQAVSNHYNQSVTVSVAGDNPQDIGREVTEQVTRSQQRLVAHNNRSDIKQ